ncbi:MAG: glycosyltransferase, partial [Candidatus Omnitrophica bacterium]|nr:glycosyltransferase [Candidatus Omnitrophota bacterium]
MVKICQITSAHTTADIRIWHKECRSIAQAGYKVTLIAQHPADELKEDIQIRALPRSRNRFTRMTSIVWRAYVLALKENAGVYHFHDPELLIAGILLKLNGKKVIYDAHEDYYNSLLSFDREWFQPSLRYIFAISVLLMEKIGVLFFDAVIAVTPTVAKRFPPSKTTIVSNFPILNELAVKDTSAYNGRRPIITYIGGISERRGIKEMMEALELLPRDPEICLEIAGIFSSPQLQEKILAMPGAKKARFLGWQSRQGIADILGRARVGLAVLHPTKSYIDSYPTKLFEYMAVGLPVIVSDFPLWNQIVGKNQCGVCVDPLNPRDIA